MTADIAASIASIEAGLVRLHRPVVDLLNPGLSSEEIVSAIESRELATHSELIRLYSWRNGTDTAGARLDDLHLVPGFYFLSLEDALANYDAFRKDVRWNPGWLPVLASGGGDFIVQECSFDHAGSERIFHFRIEAVDHPVEYDSLGAMLATYAAAFERGVFYLDSSGFLEMNDISFSGLAASMNPSVAWWTS